MVVTNKLSMVLLQNYTIRISKLFYLRLRMNVSLKPPEAAFKSNYFVQRPNVRRTRAADRVCVKSGLEIYMSSPAEKR